MYPALLALTTVTALQHPINTRRQTKLGAGFGAPKPKQQPKKEYSKKALEAVDRELGLFVFGCKVKGRSYFGVS